MKTFLLALALIGLAGILTTAPAKASEPLFTLYRPSFSRPVYVVGAPAYVRLRLTTTTSSVALPGVVYATPAAVPAYVTPSYAIGGGLRSQAIYVAYPPLAPSGDPQAALQAAGIIAGIGSEMNANTATIHSAALRAHEERIKALETAPKPLPPGPPRP